MAANLLATFANESEELLTDFEQSLMTLESDPGNEEAVHQIFRAAHTLKSGAGMIGLPPFVELAHVAEEVLERVRNHELEIDAPLATTLLRCVDEFRRMVSQVAVGQEVTRGPDHPTLLNSLARLIVAVSLAGPPAARQGPVASTRTASRVYRIDMEFRGDIFITGQDPAQFVLELEELGEVLEVTVDDGQLPSLDKLDPSQCYLTWRVQLRTEHPREKLDDVFMFVADDNNISITDVTSSRDQGFGLASADMKIGELLMAEGCVREQDITEALQHQKRLGEVLVDLGKVKKEALNKVLTKQAVARQVRQATSVRVDTEKLDKLLNLVGEMVIAISQVSATGVSLVDSAAEHAAAIESLEVIGRELQGQVLSTRMMPIEETFNRFKRLVRDLCQDLGKYAVIETFGTETELDKTVLEQLADPLKHMIRNAVAHGLEEPAERLRFGKSDTGRIQLRAAQRQGHILVEVVDDGRGIDPDAVLAKARSRGLISPDARLSEKQIFDLLFLPGFSTAKEVSEVSGRGVGLDVVRKNVVDLRGTVEIVSAIGRGTTFRIRLPMTLAIIEGMNVQVGAQTLTLPLSSVVELLTVRNATISTIEGKGELVCARDEFLPLVRLGELLGVPPPATNASAPVIVIVETDTHKFGLMVDRVLGMDQTVIKPLQTVFSLVSTLEPGFCKPEGVAGATIRGDGDVALILDVPGLERMAFGECRGAL